MRSITCLTGFTEKSLHERGGRGPDCRNFLGQSAVDWVCVYESTCNHIHSLIHSITLLSFSRISAGRVLGFYWSFTSKNSHTHVGMWARVHMHQMQNSPHIYTHVCTCKHALQPKLLFQCFLAFETHLLACCLLVATSLSLSLVLLPKFQMFTSSHPRSLNFTIFLSFSSPSFMHLSLSHNHNVPLCPNW